MKRVGSTALALTEKALCPVAVLRGYDAVVRRSGGWIAVELDQSPQNDDVVERAIDEARLRGAQLRVLTRCQSDEGDRDGPDARLAALIQSNPDMDIRSVSVCGSIVNYLNEHLRSVKLVVVGADSLVQTEEANHDAGSLNLLGDTDCPLLLVRGISRR